MASAVFGPSRLRIESQESYPPESCPDVFADDAFTGEIIWQCYYEL